MTSSTVGVTPVPGKPRLLLSAYDLATVGYVAEEFFVSATASRYGPTGELGADGCWEVTRCGAADFTTRVVVLTPADPARFNGTVLVEWLNVSGGIDAAAVWMMAHREILRAGDAYVAVSAQRVGVEGGESLLGADMSLKSQDPQRYAALHHPGDAFSYDIFSQIGGLLKTGGHTAMLRGLPARHVIALGESQSAMFLTTYINAVDPLAGVFDGFLVHSRFGPAAPLDGTSIFTESTEPQAVTFRPELRVPVLTLITETDVFGGPREGYYFARQPDNPRLRVWEIAGAAHADNYTIQVAFIDSGSAPLEDIVSGYAPTNMLMGQQLPHYINFGPQHHYVVQAALAALNTWVTAGQPAPAPSRCRCGKALRRNRFWTATGWPAAASAPRGWTSRSPEPRGSAVRRASCRRSSAPANRSTPPPSSGCIPVGGPNIWSASPSRWTRRSAPGSSCPPTAPRYCGSPPRRFRARTAGCPAVAPAPGAPARPR
ncbi:hypothetical protein BB735_024270 [Mycobacterium avium subsp. hominissuis]|nr:hypothetical protein [Mycobacterium avium subsp. hominissuis]QXD05925.1 hypothetical protein BB735_024270 [Mycobacterium avium subsp. hominissuis]UBV05144.1 hypothetical protein H8Z54_22780 [Mycobacterium avium subsp. hominissuis]